MTFETNFNELKRIDQNKNQIKSLLKARAIAREAGDFQ
jgi:hypothetical protein